jgi:methanogenic corrinoid protein MtbC1
MTSDMSASQAVRERLERLLAAHDRPGAVSEALGAVEAGTMAVPALYNVLRDVMAGVGARWQRGETKVWEEHLATAAVRTIVDALYPFVLAEKAKAAPTGKSVLLACPADEAHDLGLRMLADLFDLAGWSTYLLGPDTPTEEIAAAASSLGVDLILLTSATHFHRMRLTTVLQQLHEQLPGTRVVVTGGAFAEAHEGLRPDESFDPAEFLPWTAGAGAGA